jgi:hypothetical protein
MRLLHYDLLGCERRVRGDGELAANLHLRRATGSLIIALTFGLAISITYNFVKSGSMLPVAYFKEAA